MEVSEKVYLLSREILQGFEPDTMKSEVVTKLQKDVDQAAMKVEEKAKDKSLEGQLQKWDALSKQIDHEEKLEEAKARDYDQERK